MPHVGRRNIRAGFHVERYVRNIFRSSVLAGLALALVAACGTLPGSSNSPPASTSSAAPSAPAATPVPSSAATPSGTPGRRTAAPVTQVTSPAQAAAVVFASDPVFASITQPEPGSIGASTSYQASQVGDKFSVSVTIGSGDCPAGCINQHTWNYTVSNNGTVTLVSEQGGQVVDPIDRGTPDPAQVTIRLVAGPVCPVERNPPDPSCAPRPVPGGLVVLRDPSGAQVGQAVADAGGKVAFSVPGGAYYAEASAVEGLMRQAEPQAFSVPGGRNATIVMEYDTGIR